MRKAKVPMYCNICLSFIYDFDDDPVVFLCIHDWSGVHSVYGNNISCMAQLCNLHSIHLIIQTSTKITKVRIIYNYYQLDHERERERGTLNS